ncbi:HD-GYP domain, c-di-GMP phosphodiesterase class II (or its inactivated variant) [Andreprevotia lacus DSM 23236]|jgi:response regulator RpfG family c-di-GMP phosphodiesterase|uniref:HD-GYP domain, c-di-GMP phosphodiesterase class II (Or its inactivated variant) n=1 Tax=Andreprevotia lacus DSM 23236 TaxID=1121001 RepID=A0A1W1XW80_9NEIS|nr:HD domain-containing phosphohydrolase [Andreprevotia lacus]SMC28186.1 HD-GYP domain, c-di-GMP phosphodiesterase class II (or its inactivated variant) [Andreprevotia lacus DSM 23236]
MEDDIVLNPVNPHYLDRVVRVSETQGVEASEDIYSASGIKLVAKGARIGADMHDRLIVHKLKKPLESCIRVQNGTDSQRLHDDARALFEENSKLKALFDHSSVLSVVQEIPLRPATLGLLDVAAAQDRHGLKHYLLVMLISLAIARRMKCGAEIMRTVAMASLLHDIGELYIERRYLEDEDSELAESDWRKIAAHPVIGQKLACDVCGMPQAVGIAILEHHERASGGGYPRGLTAGQLSLPGQIISIAEMIAALSEHYDRPLERMALVVKLVPGEYGPELIAALSAGLELDMLGEETPVPVELTSMMLSTLFERIESVRHLINACQRTSGQDAGETRAMLDRVKRRFTHIQQALMSTGVGMYCSADGDCSVGLNQAPASLLYEVDAIQNEIRWQMRALSRDLQVRAALVSPAAALAFSELVEALDVQ